MLYVHFQPLDAAAEEEEVVGGVEGLGEPLARSKRFTARLFHSVWVPEKAAAVNEQGRKSCSSKWNNF
jgi:hypothetical protein